MRLLRVTTINQAYLNKFYKKNNVLIDKSYDDQQASLFYDAYAHSDSYSHYLAKYGYECREIVANALPIQKAWCCQNNVSWDESNYVKKLPIEYAKRFKPEIVCLDGSIFDTGWVQELRLNCPSIRLVFGFYGISPASYDFMRGYDIVFTPVQSLARQFVAAGLDARVLPHAFDPRILQKIDVMQEKTFALTFIGSVVRINYFHKRRARFLEELSENFALTVFTNDAADPMLKQFVRVASYDLFAKLKKLGVTNAALLQFPLIGKYILLQDRPRLQRDHSLWSRVFPPVYGLEMYNALVQSQVTLNTHAECAGNSAGNMRLFEATGVGTCLLTDYKNDLHLLFEPDHEVVTYKTVEECKEKLKWLFEHPDKRKQIAMAGMKRTLNWHTYEKRAALMDEMFRAGVR